jgi:hypothetical protein
VRELGLQTRVSGVDHWQGDFQTGDYGEELYQSLKTYHDGKYAEFSTLIRSSFAEALGAFGDGSIDLLHIDGLHTYEAVQGDFASWLPKMSRRGVVLFHDTTVLERQFGVWKLWEELTGRYPSFSFAHGYGLGVLLVGAEVAGPVRELAGLGPAEGDMVRATFLALGRHIRAIEAQAIARGAVEAAKAKVEAAMEEEARRMAEEVIQARDKTREEVSSAMRRLADMELQALAQAYEKRLELAELERRRLTEAHAAALAEQREERARSAAASAAEIAALRKYVDELKRAIAEMYASRSFKLGRAITSPARLVRKAMKGA